jgi:hypothetical protein
MSCRPIVISIARRWSKPTLATKLNATLMSGMVLVRCAATRLFNEVVPHHRQLASLRAG